MHIKGCRDIISKKYCILSEDLYYLSSHPDPDETQHYAAFHLGLYCLQKYLFRGFPEYKGLIVVTGLLNGTLD